MWIDPPQTQSSAAHLSGSKSLRHSEALGMIHGANSATLSDGSGSFGVLKLSTSVVPRLNDIQAKGCDQRWCNAVFVMSAWEAANRLEWKNVECVLFEARLHGGVLLWHCGYFGFNGLLPLRRPQSIANGGCTRVTNQQSSGPYPSSAQSAADHFHLHCAFSIPFWSGCVMPCDAWTQLHKRNQLDLKELG